jgi:hypothetical protein
MNLCLLGSWFLRFSTLLPTYFGLTILPFRLFGKEFLGLLLLFGQGIFGLLAMVEKSFLAGYLDFFGFLSWRSGHRCSSGWFDT